MFGGQDPTPAGDGGAMPVPGGMITNLDAMVQMSHFDNAGAGAWNDADMLQICNHRDSLFVPFLTDSLKGKDTLHLPVLRFAYLL